MRRVDRHGTKRPRRHAVSIAALASLLAAPPDARACLEGPLYGEVHRLSALAAEALDREQPTVAVRHYAGIRALIEGNPACAAELAAVRFYEGLALEGLCRVDEALEAYRDSLRGPLADELRARVPGLLRVACTAPCVDFSVEGRPEGRLACGDAGLLPPGGHRVVGRAGDGRAHAQVAVVSAGEATHVRVDLPPQPLPPADDGIPAGTWLLAGAAVVALAAGVTANVLARGSVTEGTEARDRSDAAAAAGDTTTARSQAAAANDAYDEARTRAAWSYGLFGASALLAAGAGVSWWLATPDAPGSGVGIRSIGVAFRW